MKFAVKTMITIHEKTLQDLEFPTVLKHVSQACKTTLGKAAALQIRPYTDVLELHVALAQTNEYVSSFDNDNRIPNHEFDSINHELKLLHIENTYLEVSSLKKLANITTVVNRLLAFINEYKTYYPSLHATSSKIEIAPTITQNIDRIIDRFGVIKDDASPTLFDIRQAINRVKNKINQSFSSALANYHNLDYLDDIRESVIENKRVLAVKAMYRRRVRGAIMGGSRTGSIVYIEPEITLQATRELNNLEYEEAEEVVRILKKITDYLRPFLPLLESYQTFLVLIDIIAAKARYAQSMHAILPEITETRNLLLREAYHPLLYLNNLKTGEKTHPQTIELTQSKRIIVISGPNAGGKSITLKTIGLLQVMLQSGLLIPVHERSQVKLFNRILTDIGDNQSIENHLSTYSYRLKQMRYFLRTCDAETLFLIDEFGTGSDPELGGALAEVFLEEFYSRHAFGIITTHYANLKLLANELPDMCNANMLFNERNLEPLFKLVIGQAGSSFTFEVAQKNGIAYRIINRAKKKIERSKVRFDATIAKLQKERSKLEQTEQSLKRNERKKLEETDKLEATNSKIQKKLESYQELYDSNQRLIYLGQKVNTLAEVYFNNQRKKDLMAALFKLVQLENAKRKTRSPKEQNKQKAEKKHIEQEVEKQIIKIRKQKKLEKKTQHQAPQPKPILNVGDRVRIPSGRAVGTIDRIEKNKAWVDYGAFTTSVGIEQLELVEAKKHDKHSRR